jgi:hypothetical protein
LLPERRVSAGQSSARSDRSSPTHPQDDLLDVLFWWRHLVSIVFGVIWGILPMTGFYGFML